MEKFVFLKMFEKSLIIGIHAGDIMENETTSRFVSILRGAFVLKRSCLYNKVCVMQPWPGGQRM